MRKNVWLIGILIIALLAAGFMSGCGKKQSSSVATTSGGKNGSTAGTESAVAGPANNLTDLLNKYKGLSSYTMTMDTGMGKTTMSFKLDDAKPVAMKMASAQGTMLMQLDKKIMYMINPATKTAMSMPLDDKTIQQSQKDPMEQLKTASDAKVSSETVDGIDCLKVTNAGSTTWCDKETGLPVQIELMGKLTKIKCEQINSVPDSEFELPAGIKVQQMPAAPTGAPKGP